jgi:erythromycin esterase
MADAKWLGLAAWHRFFLSGVSRNNQGMVNSRFGTWPLSTSRDLDALIDSIGDARLVLLGEASHGTHEYYTWRSAISRRLIEEKGFNFIAVEGDWPDCYRVNRYVKGYDQKEALPQEVLLAFNRWPTWMWANWETAALVSWLKDRNKGRNTAKRAGFYGLDVYSLWESIQVLVDYLTKNDPPAARIAEKVVDCFAGYSGSEKQYALNSLSAPCRNEVVKLLKEMKLKSAAYDQDPEAALNTLQNAHITVEAEKYYRNMVALDDQTWNIRDRHMMDTLNRLMEFHGAASKAIVWAHNTHVGDASFTSMADEGLFNLGQLAREEYPGGQTYIVGFGSYEGTVMAGSSWGAPAREMELPAGKTGSLEYLLHSESSHNRLIVFNGGKEERFKQSIPHRAVGVVYAPGHEHHNYVPTQVSRRYDAFIYLDQTRALSPLFVRADKTQVPETYPFEF